MVFRLFVILMFANIVVAANKAHANQVNADLAQEMNLHTDFQPASRLASDDQTGRNDCVRRLVSMMASYFFNRVTAVRNVQATDQGQSEATGVAGIVAGSSRPEISFLFDGTYAVDLEKGGAVLHWKYDF